MSLEQFLTVAGLVLSALTYFAGVQRGKRQEKERQEHDRSMESRRETRALMNKLVDEYVSMAKAGKDNGPHALATLGLHVLGSDSLVRQAIEEMGARTGQSPWQGAESHVKDVNLVDFFRIASEQRVNFFSTPVEQHCKSVREAGGVGGA